MSEKMNRAELRAAEKKNKKRDIPKLPVIIPLEFPIMHGKKELTEVQISRRIKVKDMRMIADCETNGEAMQEMLGTCLGLPDSVIDDIDAVDMEPIMDKLELFLPSNGPEAGKKGWRS